MTIPLNNTLERDEAKGALMDNPHTLRNWIKLRKEYKKPIDEDEFDRGVKLAEWYKENYAPDGWTAATLNSHYFCNWLSDKEQAAFLRQYIKLFINDTLAFDTLSDIAHNYIKDDKQLHGDLKTWTLEVLSGDRKRPAKRGPVPGRTLPRNRAIVLAIKHLESDLWYATRNSDSRTRHSAADAVAKAFELEFNTVVDVWEKHRNDY